MKTKRVISFLLSFALLLTSVTGVSVQQAKAAETAKKIVVYVAAEGKNGSGDEVTVPKTAVQVTEGSTAETAVTQVLDHFYKDDYVYSSGFLSSIGKVAGTSEPPYVYWGFQVNGEEPQNPETGWGYGIGDYPLKDHDQISLVYGEYGSMPKECSSYTKDAFLEFSEAEQTAILTDAKKQQSILAQKIYETTFQNGAYIPGITDSDSLYCVFSLAQAGFQADTFYNAVASKVVSELKTLQAGGKVSSADGKTSYTLEEYEANRSVLMDYAKTALALSALGQDITNAGGIDLTKKITDKAKYEIANPTTLTRESLILFVMDGVDAAWPSGDYLTRAELIKNLINDIDTQIGYATDWSNVYGATLDSAVMVIQALAPYYEAEVSEVDSALLNEKVECVLDMMETLQDNSGGYGDPNNNPWTLAQVMTTAGLYKIDPLKDTLVFNGKTLFDASAQYVDTQKNTTADSLVPAAMVQLLRGITSCLRAAEGKAGLYDMRTPTYKAVVTDVTIDQPADTTNACKKVKAAKTSYTIKKKGKTVKAVFKITEADTSKKTTDKVTAKVKNKKVAKVTKTKLTKGKLTVTVKGLKKGKTVLTVKVGKKTAKTTIKVKR